MQGNSKEYVMYESFDELPEELKEKFKCGAKGWNLKQAKDGYVDFINLLSKRGDKLARDYVSASTKTQIGFCKCGHVANIAPSIYKNGNGCGICKGMQVQQGVNDLATTHPHLVKQWHPTKNELTLHDVTQGSNKKVWWKCEKGHEWEVSINKRTGEGNSCPYCSNQKVLKGYNDIATTHPQHIKYFINKEDAHIHTHSSTKKVELKCPVCESVKTMIIYNLTRQGFSCDLCSDGIRYPEKLMAFVLSRLGIEFTKQMSYDNGEHRYDFYLPKHGVILETHGMQHYEHGFKKFGRTLEEEQENDKYKRKLAISNGILNNNYHEIDCRYSTLEYCRPNIEQVLSNYIDMSTLTDEDWKEVEIKAQKSLKIEVCKYWKENKEVNSALTAQQVANVFGLHNATIRNYLKWGSAKGFCTYDAKEEREAKNKRRSKFIYLIKPNGNKWFEEAMSIIGVERSTGISQHTLSNNLNKGALKYNHRAKYPKEFIGSYVVSAEVYDSQTQSS